MGNVNFYFDIDGPVMNIPVEEPFTKKTLGKEVISCFLNQRFERFKRLKQRFEQFYKPVLFDPYSQHWILIRY